VNSAVMQAHVSGGIDMIHSDLLRFIDQTVGLFTLSLMIQFNVPLVMSFLTKVSQHFTFRFRCCGEEHLGQHVDSSVRRLDGSTRRQSSLGCPRSRPIQRPDIPEDSIEEARDHDSSRQGLHHDRHSESD
jgi:hypothetical protein